MVQTQASSTGSPRMGVTTRPFKGFCANQEFVSQIIAPAYDTLNTQEARDMSAGNEKSFLHVNKPEIDLPAETDPYDASVYAMGRTNLDKWKAKGWLVQDDVPRMYIYQLTMGSHTQKGLLHLSSCLDYAEGRIKRHEFTLAKKEKDRTDLTDKQSANIGPVFLTFKEHQDEVNARMTQIIDSTASYGDVTCDDGVRHVLWKCSVEDSAYFEEMFG